MLTTKALVAVFSCSQWTARKLDKGITQEVNNQHGASPEAGRWNKLIANKQFLLPISKVVNAARTYHYTSTLPWGNNGEGLLPSAMYFEYVNSMNKFQSDFETEVQKFINSFEDIKDRAKEELNGMFREEDYPTQDELYSKFNFKVTMLPVPEADFRVSLGDDEIAQLKLAAESEIKNRMDAAIGDMWQRVKDVLFRMKEKLSSDRKDKDGNEKAQVYRDSLFDNVSDLIELLPKLNVTGDSNILQICEDMKTLLANPDDVRKNVILRKQKADEVDAVLNKFKAFF